MEFIGSWYNDRGENTVYNDMGKLNIYIDGNNLYRSAKKLGFRMDYKEFRGWLRQKYSPVFVYLFIGLVPSREKFYEYLQKCGYVLVFKRVVFVGEHIKGNCDAELILKTVVDFHETSFTSCVLITGDGDFGCLVEFLREKRAIDCVISPDRNKCSFLLRNKNVKLIFLNEHYHKFSKIIKKAPDADVSALGSLLS